MNPNSAEVVLGRNSRYVDVGNDLGSTYFRVHDDVWNATSNMFGVGEKGMWKINRAFLNQQIAQGKMFILSNAPVPYGFFGKEFSYIVSRSIKFMFI